MSGKFYSIGDDTKVEITYENDEGATCTITRSGVVGDKQVTVKSIRLTTYYNTLQCFMYPKSCYNCPSGYQGFNCGRNVPWTEIDEKQRPSTCRLKVIDIKPFIDFVLQE